MKIFKFLCAAAAVLLCMAVVGCSFGGSSLPSGGSSHSTGGEQSSQSPSGSSTSSSTNEISPPEPCLADPILKWNAEEGALSWNDVGATVYTVYLNGEYFGLTENLSYSVADLKYGIYSAEVRCYAELGDQAYSKGTLEFVVKAQPPEVAADGMTISWQAADGALYYEIYARDDSGKVTFIAQIQGNSYTAEADGEYFVKVVFGDERLSSDLSAPVAVGDLPLTPPQNVRQEGDSIIWSAVVGAQLYIVYADGKTVYMGNATSFDFRSKFEERFAESHPNGVSITVVCRADGKEDSKPSSPITYK